MNTSHNHICTLPGDFPFRPVAIVLVVVLVLVIWLSILGHGAPLAIAIVATAMGALADKIVRFWLR